jgi:hypothetical protein
MSSSYYVEFSESTTSGPSSRTGLTGLIRAQTFLHILRIFCISGLPVTEWPGWPAAGPGGAGRVLPVSRRDFTPHSTRTNARMRARAAAHTHANVRGPEHTCARRAPAPACVRTSTHAHTNEQTQAHRRTHTCAHARAHTSLCVHAVPTRALSRARKRTIKHWHDHAPARSRPRATRTNVHANATRRARARLAGPGRAGPARPGLCGRKSRPSTDTVGWPVKAALHVAYREASLTTVDRTGLRI